MVPALQPPEALHVDAVVRELAVQDAAAPQLVALPGKTQAFRFCVVPSHLPAQAPLPVQGVLGVVDGRQLPRVPATLHDSH
jgi:hypothetical protein